MKKEASKSQEQKIFKLAGISGIAIPLILILGMLLASFIKINAIISSAIVIVTLVVMLAAIITFNYGYYLVGRRYNSKSLKFASIAFIALILILIAVLAFFVMPKASELSQIFISKAATMNIDIANIDQTTATSLVQELSKDQSFISGIAIISGIIIGMLLLFTLAGLFCSIGLKNCGKPSSYPNMNIERFTGIIGIVGFCLFALSMVLPILSVISLVLLIIFYVFSIIILFKESKK